MSQSTIQYLKQCILDATADDYENVLSMASQIEKWAASDHQRFSNEQLADAIEMLTRDGKLHVYRYSRDENKYLAADYSKNDIEDLWFSSR